MEALGKSHRTYALDFWGFGESGKKRTTYAIQDFVRLVDEFMGRLGIDRAPVVGHSMGGTVGLSLALQFPQRVSKIAVVGSPIVGSSLAVLLKLAGYRPLAFLAHTFSSVLRLGIRLASPWITRDRRWYGMISRDLSHTTLESFLLSIASLRRTDLRPVLGDIRVPVLGIYGAKDVIVHPDQWRPLLANAPHTRVVRLERSGHFPMLDEPERFRPALLSFLDEPTA